MSETPASPIDLAGYLKADNDAHLARAQRLAVTWVDRLLTDAGITDIPEQVDIDEYQQAVLAVGADLHAQRKAATGQGLTNQAETQPLQPRRDARAQARLILRDYLGLGFA